MRASASLHAVDVDLVPDGLEIRGGAKAGSLRASKGEGRGAPRARRRRCGDPPSRAQAAGPITTTRSAMAIAPRRCRGLTRNDRLALARAGSRRSRRRGRGGSWKSSAENGSSRSRMCGSGQSVRAERGRAGACRRRAGFGRPVPRKSPSAVAHEQVSRPPLPAAARTSAAEHLGAERHVVEHAAPFEQRVLLEHVTPPLAAKGPVTSRPSTKHAAPRGTAASARR